MPNISKLLLPLPRQNWHIVKDEKLREMLERDYAELKRLIQAGANKSILVMCGSILEASLISALQEKNPSEDYIAQGWVLGKLIRAAVKPGILDETKVNYASSLNEYRNLIHPGLEHREKIDLNDDTVIAAVSLFKNVLSAITPPPLPPSRDAFVEELKRSRNEEETIFAERVFDWAEEKHITLSWGKGKIMTCNLKIKHNDLVYGLIRLSTNGKIQFKFGNLKNKHPFRQKTKRTELRVRFNSISSRINLSEQDMGKFPTIPMSVILKKQRAQKFFRTLQWLVNRIKR